MAKFVELGVSIFDPEFTLNPYGYLHDLYQDDDVIGFIADGIKFLFKFKHCKEVMFNNAFARPSGDAELNAKEIEYAEKYPARAYYFSLDHSHGAPDLKLKSIMVRLIMAISECASFEKVAPIAKQLQTNGRIDNYIDAVTQLPLRLYLEVCGLRYTEADIAELHESGCQFIKSFESQGDEEQVAIADTCIQFFNAFVGARFDELQEGDLLYSFLQEGREAGISEDKLQANLGNVILISLSNTFGVSSAFVLRNLIRNPEIIKTLKSNPGLIDKDETINEILRLDNHVKALSRAATETVTVDGYRFEKGDIVFLFFPGLNHDPVQWENPAQFDPERDFTNGNNLIFGGSIHQCIGKKFTFTAMKSLLRAFIEYWPVSAEIVEDDMAMDGSWLAERIITHMPIRIEN